MKKTTLFLTMALLTLFSFTACGKQGPEETDNEETKPYQPIALTKAEEEIGQAANQFGFDVYHKLYKGDEMLISPLSLSLALSMTANGAVGQTADEMLSTMGFKGQSIDDMNTYYQKMVTAMLEADPKTTFEVANSIWADENIGIKKSFTDATSKYYSSDVFPADFSTQATVNKVNGWVSEKTHGKIPTILNAPDRNLKMALINALYFNGKWAFKFSKNTKKEDFTNISGSKSKVDMMSAEEDLTYAEYDGFRMVSLPYGNGAFSMDVILPKEGEDFGKEVARFNAATLQSLIDNGSTAPVYLKLPKFTFSYSADLVEILKSLGMNKPFSNLADFSAMAEQSLKISMVMQKTFIDVNEKGTEAAAVTFVGMVATSVGPGYQPKPVEFFANRPFLFTIREKSTGAVIFVGQKVK